MSDDRVLAAIMSLDAAIAQLQAMRIALAQSVLEDRQEVPQDDTPKNGCEHKNRVTVATMGTPVFLCSDCEEQMEGDT